MIPRITFQFFLERTDIWQVSVEGSIEVMIEASDPERLGTEWQTHPQQALWNHSLGFVYGVGNKTRLLHCYRQEVESFKEERIIENRGSVSSQKDLCALVHSFLY
ncbi:MAG: hypothetical protein JSW12_22245 [Deltaproteobacteria bacterium]|nr:MAG: hypothetical protein JSW12_22245 [Deltaproteobacteria bacterium]